VTDPARRDRPLVADREGESQGESPGGRARSDTPVTGDYRSVNVPTSDSAILRDPEYAATRQRICDLGP